MYPPIQSNHYSCIHIYANSCLQPSNWQVSKEEDYKLEFGDIAVMQILTICSEVTETLILIGSLGCLKEAKTMDMII